MESKKPNVKDTVGGTLPWILDITSYCGPRWPVRMTLGKRSCPLLLLLVPHAVRDEKVLLEEILREVVKGFVVGAQAIGRRDAGDAGEFVHVLYHVSDDLPEARDGIPE